jgi:hypothetical protein
VQNEGNGSLSDVPTQMSIDAATAGEGESAGAGAGAGAGEAVNTDCGSVLSKAQAHDDNAPFSFSFM